MLHPQTKLKWISDAKGFGVFATAPLPKGTVTFVQDLLDVCIDLNDPLLDRPEYKQIVDKYSYINNESQLVISWDHGKYMNHCCFSNTLTTGYGFEIAVRDIEAGEEITDNYGIFTIHHNMEMSCPKQNCYKRVSIDDFEKHSEAWDKEITEALQEFNTLDQPLKCFLTPETLNDLELYLSTSNGYISVTNQKPGIKERKLYNEKLKS